MDTNDGTDARAPKEAAHDEPAKAEKPADASASTPAEEKATKGSSGEEPKEAAEKSETAEASKADGEAAEDEAAKEGGDAKEAEATEADAAEEEPKKEATTSKSKSASITRAAPPPPPGSSGTLAGLVALLILVGGVVGSIMIMRRNESSGAPKKGAQAAAKKEKESPWQVGQKVAVSITVLPNDDENLECVASTEIAGRHCAYEAKDTVWSKGDNNDDEKLLRPYSTTNRKRLLGAGFWSQIKPSDRPQGRFSVKCTFEIEGKLENPMVRFKAGIDFREIKETWMAGQLTHCAIEKH